jgi:hypothetical protein
MSSRELASSRQAPDVGQGWEDDGMAHDPSTTHDPLCPRIAHALEHWVSDCDSPECDEVACECNLIAKARAGEQVGLS